MHAWVHACVLGVHVYLRANVCVKWSVVLCRCACMCKKLFMRACVCSHSVPTK